MARIHGAACSNIPNEQDMLLLVNYRPEYFRRNTSNGITVVHTGSAVRAVGLRGRVRGHGID